MTSRIVCKKCGAESFADGASLACWTCYTASQAEVERMRAALEKIARYEYRGGKSAPTSYPDINYPAAADIALLVLDRGEEE